LEEKQSAIFKEIILKEDIAADKRFKVASFTPQHFDFGGKSQ